MKYKEVRKILADKYGWLNDDFFGDKEKKLIENVTEILNNQPVERSYKESTLQDDVVKALFTILPPGCRLHVEGGIPVWLVEETKVKHYTHIKVKLVPGGSKATILL